MSRARRITHLASPAALVLAALAVHPAVAADHQARQTRPIQLGTSGGSIEDITAAGACCGGTLGSLVTDGTSQYILSNNHVIARSNAGRPGDVIVQPGLPDNSCQEQTADAVASLSVFWPVLPSPQGPNRIDAALARVEPGMVDPDGAILDVGPISGTPVAATVGLAVKKSGRSTGLTTGHVVAVGGTVTVDFSKRCGGKPGTGSSAQFVDQVQFDRLSGEGDSGSLILTDTGSCPQPVALLFAGNGIDVTWGNPIGTVLDNLHVSFVTGPCGAGLGAPAPADLGIQHAVDVAKRAAPRLLGVSGIVGVAASADETGRPVVLVDIERDDARLRDQVPATIEDLPVRIMVTGRFSAN